MLSFICTCKCYDEFNHYYEAIMKCLDVWIMDLAAVKCSSINSEIKPHSYNEVRIRCFIMLYNFT